MKTKSISYLFFSSAKNVNGINGLENGNAAAIEETSALAKMQLSNPGPELASENEDIEDEHLGVDSQIVESKAEEKNLTLNKNGTNVKHEIRGTFNKHLEKNEKNKDTAAITAAVTAKSNNDSCIRNGKLKLTTTITKENEEINVNKEKNIYQTKLENEKSMIQNDYRRGKKFIKNNINDEYDIFGRKKVSVINTLDNNNAADNNNIANKYFVEKDNITAISKNNNGHTPNITAASITTTATVSNLTLENKAELKLSTNSNEKESRHNIISSASKEQNFECTSAEKGNINSTTKNFNAKILNETLNAVLECSSGKKQNINSDAISCQGQNSNNAKTSNIAFGADIRTTHSNITSESSSFGSGSGAGEMVITAESNSSSGGGISTGGDLESSILIKNANIINYDEIFSADVFIQNGLIT